MKNMKNLMMLLALCSLSTAWAMDLDERKDDDVYFPAFLDPDYSQDAEIEELYFTPAEALSELQKEIEYEDALFTALEQELVAIFPQVISHLIALYVNKKGQIQNGDYFDQLIDQTSLYATHLPPLDFSLNRASLKKLFYRKLEQSLPPEESMTLTNVLERGDTVWKNMLQTEPFPSTNERARGWKISQDKKRIVTCFLTSIKNENSENDDFEPTHWNNWYILVYDLENNSIINLTKLKKTELIGDSLKLYPDGAFTVMNTQQLVEEDDENKRFRKWSEYPVITYHPDTNMFSAKAKFFRKGQCIKTVHLEYSPQEEGFVETSVCRDANSN